MRPKRPIQGNITSSCMRLEGLKVLYLDDWRAVEKATLLFGMRGTVDLHISCILVYRLARTVSGPNDPQRLIYII